MKNHQALIDRGYQYAVIAAYDGPFGDQGDLISKHRTYKAAEKAANRRAPSESRNWIKIIDLSDYA
jgi:hypothetical protein